MSLTYTNHSHAWRPYQRCWNAEKLWIWIRRCWTQQWTDNTDYSTAVTLYRAVCPSATATQANARTRTHTDIQTNKEKSLPRTRKKTKAFLFGEEVKWTGSRQTRLLSVKPSSVHIKSVPPRAAFSFSTAPGGLSHSQVCYSPQGGAVREVTFVCDVMLGRLSTDAAAILNNADVKANVIRLITPLLKHNAVHYTLF